LEGPVGFEPTTRGLKGRCSNLLSYGPIFGFAKNGKTISGVIILKTERKVNQAQCLEPELP
jgi:hypothetical protein